MTLRGLGLVIFGLWRGKGLPDACVFGVAGFWVWLGISRWSVGEGQYGYVCV